MHARTPWWLAAVGWTGALVMAAGAAMVARDGYRRTAELRLRPLNVERYAGDNARLAAPAGNRVVFFGDSRIAGWSPRPDTPGVEQVWRGIDGETTTQMAYRYEMDVLRLRPHTVVIQAGINDLVAGAAAGALPEAVAIVTGRLGDLVSRARAAGIRVVLTQIVPPATPPLIRRLVWSDDIHPALREVNRRLAALAADDVVLLDASTLLDAGDGPLPAEFAADTLHFRASAYERLNGALLPLLAASHAVQ